MHRLATMPGGWEAGSTEGVIFVEQTPAPIVVLTAADTDIQILAAAQVRLPDHSPSLRVANLLQLQQQLSIDHYGESVLNHAQVIIVRLLGGRAYWSYGLERVKEIVAHTGAHLYVLPGDDRPDPDLISHSNVGLSAVHQLWQYFTEGGIDNCVQGLQFITHHHFDSGTDPLPPQPVPRIGLFPASLPESCLESQARVGLLFYRAHYLAGNVDAIASLCQALIKLNLIPVPIFVQSLQDPAVQAELVQLLNPPDRPGIDLLLNTTSFSLAKLAAETLNLDLWQQLDVPVLQVICSGGTLERWQTQLQGLAPRDMAMNVALPEVDGRIISRAVSFKAVQTYNFQLETDVVSYQPLEDRIQFVAALTANWVKLRQCNPSERRIALILANYPSRDGRLANGVGLDTPASCIAILEAMQAAGYTLEGLPKDGDQLIEWLTTGVTNDSEWSLRQVYQQLALADYEAVFAQMPSGVQQQMCDRWGSPSQAAPDGFFAIAGMQLGNVFIGIQPARGYDLDPSLNYHAPDLEPTHGYLAFYIWLRQQFQTHAVIHVGKHGNLEWLPGKSIALSNRCYPEIALGPLPHLYPFIVNDPGEGAQAKRRGQAVILDHLTPPLTRAELYGPLQKLEALIDEYYDAQSLDPRRLPVIRDRIFTLVQSEQLDQDLGLGFSPDNQTGLEALLTQADGYLCELKEAQIRDGLHIFGSCPQQTQLRDLVVSLARQPSPHHQGLTRTLAQVWYLDLDPLTADPAQPLTSDQKQILAKRLGALHIVGDAIALLETEAAQLVEQLLAPAPMDLSQHPQELQAELAWIRDSLLPRLYQTDQEITHLLRGLDGRYVPSGASGAPTRGRPDVLPTGRNFYSVDIRALPTESAWDVGRKAAEVLVERYTQDHGEYPRTLGLSMWGTATMRTGGDDLAQALALLGVQPVWEGLSRRVIDFEVLPLSLLGRPRVDVTLRISGFFRDAFPNLIDLFDRAVNAVASLDEPDHDNPLISQVQQEQKYWLAEGLSAEVAEVRSRYRIFGSKPGAYGAGLQGLIESQNWRNDQDLARAYMNWSSYAYTAQSSSSSAEFSAKTSEQFAPEAFSQRLSQMQIVLHNQDNREHDLLDSDDYYQFQGGLATAVRSIQGQNPELYFGDHAVPSNPKVRKLQEEIARVYRSRVVNPKWIAGVMRHGYKGAFEMTATVDYLFAYDATTHCVADHMYQGVANSYLFNPQVQDFIEDKNPWALRDMAERLLEAHQRKLWQQASPSTLAKLRDLVHQAEGKIEHRIPPVDGSKSV